TASFTFSPNPCLHTASSFNCTLNGSASTAGSGTIVAYIWTVLATTTETAGPSFVPSALGSCAIGGAQQFDVQVTLRVRNSFNVVSGPFNALVTVRRQGVCGF